LIALTGVGLGILIYRKRPLLAMPSLLEKKYYIDEICDAVIIHPIEAGSREGLWKLFDQEVIDGFLHALGRAVTETGGVVRYLQIGFVRSYAAIILLGALALIGIFSYFGFLVHQHL
jgi:NADH:ubiquinone oxidoreductase subunit 5 (subunit L)/multisubunit Na+/H+ antiporter MnhA subunit